MSEPLLPCPFCGAAGKHGEITDHHSDDFGGHFVQCTNGMCGASTNLRFACGDDPVPLLTEQWNRRILPPADPPGDVVERARAALGNLAAIYAQFGPSHDGAVERDIIGRAADFAQSYSDGRAAEARKAAVEDYMENLRCRVTKNACGSDTWATGSPCQCLACQTWLGMRALAQPAQDTPTPSEGK
jgi:hypothetical protein